MTMTRFDPPRAAPRITARERDVLELVAEGYSTAEIARALWITEDTVRTHIKRMMVRLDARTRAHAVAIAFREGLWEPTAGTAEGRATERRSRAIQPDVASATFDSAVSRSIGIGKTIVELFDAPISSSVCR